MRTPLLFVLGCLLGCAPDVAPIDAPAADTAHPRDVPRPDVQGLDAPITPATGPWENVTANLAHMPSECGSVSGFAAAPDEDRLIVGVALHGLWESTDGGSSWHALGTGAGSDPITNRTVTLVFDPEHGSTFWEAGIYNGAGVYRTDDEGLTFHALGDLGHVDVVSIDFTDPARRVLLAGGHERSRTLHRSSDGGATWTNVGENLPVSNFSSAPLVLDASTHLVGCSGWGSDPNGIFRTTDGGAHWTQVSDAAASGAPLRASDGTIYWPLAGGGGMVRSTDDGATWEAIVGGGVVAGVHPIELPDGRLATVGMGAIVVSSDGGFHWSAATETVPFGDAVGLAYSAQRQAFYVWHFDCGTEVLADAIMRHPFEI